MSCIDLMMDEHKNIRRMLVVIRKSCSRVLNGEKVQFEEFDKIVDFVKNYADNHHHAKEEALLFTKMLTELGPTAEKLVRQGMIVEHDLGRLHIIELEEALKRVREGDMESRLDVIAHAIAYAHLLNRHVDKEDKVIYKFAQNNLSKESMDKLDQECNSFEGKASEEKTQGKYMELLSELESRFS